MNLWMEVWVGRPLGTLWTGNRCSLVLDHALLQDLYTPDISLSDVALPADKRELLLSTFESFEKFRKVVLTSNHVIGSMFQVHSFTGHTNASLRPAGRWRSACAATQRVSVSSFTVPRGPARPWLPTLCPYTSGWRSYWSLFLCYWRTNSPRSAVGACMRIRWYCCLVWPCSPSLGADAIPVSWGQDSQCCHFFRWMRIAVWVSWPATQPQLGTTTYWGHTYIPIIT